MVTLTFLATVPCRQPRAYINLPTIIMSQLSVLTLTATSLGQTLLINADFTVIISYYVINAVILLFSLLFLLIS